VTGDFASELESVARELRRQADGALFRDLTAAMRAGVAPAVSAVRRGLGPHLPARYAETLAGDLDLKVSVSTTGKEPGVSLVAKTRSGRKRKLGKLDGGVLEHPLFGDRTRWFKQELPAARKPLPGFFTGPARDSEPRVLRNLEDALERVAYEVDRRAAGG
jgi:hypothetical protein